jgi:hypothetical protein
MAGKKTRKKVAPAIEMKSNPLTRRKKSSRSRSLSRQNTVQKVKMHYNPVRDCGSIGGGKKRKKSKRRKSWFF